MPPNPVPFVVAFAVFVLLVVLAYVFLWEGDDGELVRPDAVSALDPQTVRAVLVDRSSCDSILRAQVDLTDDDVVLVELVVQEDGEDCAGDRGPLEAEIRLPEAIDGRDLRAGTGRVQIPCEGSGPSVTCAVDRYRRPLRHGLETQWESSTASACS